MGMIEILAVGKGHDEHTLGENGADNKQKVDELIGKKYSLTIEVGEGDSKTTEKVSGFDADKNEVIVKKTVQKTEETELRIPAKDAKITAVAPTAGG